MASLYRLLRPAVYQSPARRFLSATQSRKQEQSDWDELFDLAPIPKAALTKRRPRPVHLTPAEARATERAYADYFQSNDRPSFRDNETPVDSASDTQIAIWQRARESVEAEEFAFELDSLTEELDTLHGNPAGLWGWINERIILNNKRFVTSPNYGRIVLTCFDRLSRQSSPNSALALFDVVRTISPESFVAGCTDRLFYQVIKLRWELWHDIDGVHDAIKMMLEAGIDVKWDVRQLLDEIKVVLEADRLQAIEAAEKLQETADEEAKKRLIEGHSRFAPAERQSFTKLELLLADADDTNMDPSLDESEDNLSRRKSRYASKTESDWLAALRPPQHNDGDWRAIARQKTGFSNKSLDHFDDWLEDTSRRTANDRRLRQ